MSTCEITRVTYREPPGRFAQLWAEGTVVDGARAGEPVAGAMSLSPRAAFRRKRWLGWLDAQDAELYFEDEDDDPEMVAPDLRGRRLTAAGEALPEPFDRA